jgi:hypothetical protein
MIIYTTSIQMSLHLKILLIFKRLPLTVTFTLVSTTEEDDKRDDFTFQWSTSPSSVAIIQHPQRMDITFHNSYVTLELVSSTVGRAQLLTQFVLKKVYFAPMLWSSLQKFYSRHHDLADRYEISISKMTMDLLLFM